MKKILFLTPMFVSSFCFSQSHQIKLTSPGKKKPVYVKEGDKVLMAVKVARHQAIKKPSDVYLLSKPEASDSVYVFTKGRIKTISDSSIVMKERNSIFSASNREIRIGRINTLRKLTTGNQLFRTATTVGGGLALGVTVFYSYASVGNCDGCVEGMFYAAGTTAVLTRFGRTKIAKKHLDHSKIEVVTLP